MNKQIIPALDYTEAAKSLNTVIEQLRAKGFKESEIRRLFFVALLEKL